MRRTKPDLILAGHGFLAGSMALWRAVEATPWLTSRRGAGLLGHPAGEALLAAWMLAAVAALVGVLALTLRERRTITLVLAALLIGALWRRQTFGAFDLAYLLAVPVALALRAAARAPAAGEGPDRMAAR